MEVCHIHMRDCPGLQNYPSDDWLLLCYRDYLTTYFAVEDGEKLVVLRAAS